MLTNCNQILTLFLKGGGPIRPPPKVFQKYQKKYNQQRAELVGLFRKIIYPKNKKNRMGLGAPGAAPEGSKVRLFFKNFQILKKK